ncbi:MAG TPA: histidine kinase, partial [Chitinophagaceae bacterium]|nr:histidine kinase [Chitinophagaceae bacterium]
MKRLLYFLVVVFSCELPAQRFPVKKANNEYVVTTLKESEKYRNNIKELIRDKKGLYWFHNLTEVSSFDGVNWKKYPFVNAEGRNIPVRINEIEVTDDGMIWLASAEGLYGFDPVSEKFLPINQLIPRMSEMPAITNCIYKGVNNFLLVSFVKEGFYIINWKDKSQKHVVIDSSMSIYLPTRGINQFVTTDRSGNYWGITRENKGIWFCDPTTGEVKCSWKGEIFPMDADRLIGKLNSSIVYSPKEDALLLTYSADHILEKKFLSTGKSIFYSFSGDLDIRADTNSKNRLSIQRTNIDPAGDEWVLVANKYLVKLHSDISKCEYVVHDPDLLPIGETIQLIPRESMEIKDRDNYEHLLWILGNKGLSALKKRNPLVKQIPFENLSIDGITPTDYVNRDVFKEDIPFKNLFFVKGLDDHYLLLQQNAGRPKILLFDKNLRITHALLNKDWKDYPAYFNPLVSSEEFFIAILRPQDEPLDFQNVVIKDFKINLRTMQMHEVFLSFSERVWRYGAVDANNLFWLFSNGYLYSYNPKIDLLDSIFICKPLSKGKYSASRIKGYDYPTVLHKSSSTFWISFIANKELYKIDLKKKKVDKVFESSPERRGCLSSSVIQLYNFDSSAIYLKLNFSAALLNPFNDSVIIYSDLFKNPLPYEDAVGSFVYKDWLCSVTTSEVNLQNTVTGKQKRLLLNQDLTWLLSPLSYAPPVNDRGEMILMSSAQKGFVVFNIDSILAPVIPGIVHFSQIKLNESELRRDSLAKSGSLRLKYNQYSSIHFKFSDYSLVNQEEIKYEYTLFNGGDTVWNKIEGAPELTFTKITPGNYTLLIRATNGFGEYSSMVTAFNILIIPPFTQTPWFIIMIVIIVAAILYGLYRYRLQQINKLQIVRNNIASDLHDDIGSTLNSISIYSEVAKQQAGKEIPALDMIGANSRKIIESMSDIVWTINPENDSFEKIIIRMRSFAYQLLKAKKVEYTFEVDEKLNSI